METGQQDLLVKVTSFLRENHIPYMVTGAWSVIYYGRPRASHDIDFVVEIEPRDTEKIISMLEKLSGEFQFQATAVTRAVSTKGMFNIIHLPTYLKLDFWLLTAHPFDKSRFKRKVEVDVLGVRMIFATAEDTILQKLRWYKWAVTDKNIVDAAFVYQIQKKNLDFKYLSKWANYLNVTKSLKKLETIDLEQYI